MICAGNSTPQPNQIPNVLYQCQKCYKEGLRRLLNEDNAASPDINVFSLYSYDAPPMDYQVYCVVEQVIKPTVSNKKIQFINIIKTPFCRIMCQIHVPVTYEFSRVTTRQLWLLRALSLIKIALHFCNSSVSCQFSIKFSCYFMTYTLTSSCHMYPVNEVYCIF